WRAAARSFSDLTLIGQPTFNVSDEGRPPERYSGAYVSAHLFRMIRQQPIVGRTFTADHDRFGGPPDVVLGYGIWQTRYGGGSGIIGPTIRVNDLQATVIGVMPEGLLFPPNTDLWLPMGQATLPQG